MGYANADDAISIRTLHAALDAGVRIFDTAPAYGAGHSERLLGQAFKNRPEVQIITKFGIGIEENSKQIHFGTATIDGLNEEIHGSLSRLKRDCLDLLLLHQNDMSIELAAPLFEVLDRAVEAGKIRAYGWSTDFSDRARAMADRPNFIAVEHAMNLFFDAAKIQLAVHEAGLRALIRSPLAMGVLSGKYSGSRRVAGHDIRASEQDWMEYFENGASRTNLVEQLQSVEALLKTGGRSLVQGALAWIWAKNAQNIPIPGARTPDQIIELAGALDHGPLPEAIMQEISGLIPQNSGYKERPR